jgi:hypothetical protein
MAEDQDVRTLKKLLHRLKVMVLVVSVADDNQCSSFASWQARTYGGGGGRRTGAGAAGEGTDPTSPGGAAAPESSPTQGSSRSTDEKRTTTGTKPRDERSREYDAHVGAALTHACRTITTLRQVNPARVKTQFVFGDDVGSFFQC